MQKSYVIKNTENNKYFTGDYNCWWVLDIKDARRFRIIESLERELSGLTSSENDLDAMENIKTVVVETIYDFN